MAVILKSAPEIERMRVAGRLAAEVLDFVAGHVKPGVTTGELDRLCHAFVARHLPSAGHLRFVSSVMRLTIGLERIGDYAATISRTAAQLSTHAPAIVQRDVEMMCEHARRMLHEGLRSFQNRDVALANATLTAAAQFAHHFDKVFDDLVKEGEARTRPVSDLFALMATFNRLERVIHQAKNICEETVFVGTGRTKGEKVFQILFVDEQNSGPSQLAEHFTRKAFPQSGQYRSAGWQPVEEIEPAYSQFAQKVGLDLSRAWPAPLSSLACLPFYCAVLLDRFKAQKGMAKDEFELLEFIVERMVERNVGIGIVPETTARRLVRTIVAVALTDPWAERELKICVRKLAELPPYARRLVEHLRAGR